MPNEFTRYVVTLTRNPEVPRDGDMISAHVAWLEELESKGQLDLAGPFADGQGGMLILRAASLEEAQAIAGQDPFQAAGSSTHTVRALELSCAENNHLGFGSRPGS